MKRFAICYIVGFAFVSLWGCGLFSHQTQPSCHPVEAQRSSMDFPATCPKQEVAEVIPPEPPKPEQKLPILGRRGKRAELYRSKERVYYPILSKEGYEERGVASWYGPSFHGRKTSSGETFDMYGISAAHKLLPMHAKVTVTNLENGRSTALVVNDRGPFVAGRVLDLSYAAAKILGMVERGLARVLIRSSGPLPGQKNDDIVGLFFIHIGSFKAEQAAMRLGEDMKALNYKQSIIKVIQADRDGDIHWRVELGPYGSMSHANKAHGKVVKDYPSAFVVASQ